MNRTERIKSGFVGKKVMTNVETGEKHVVDFDDTENIGVLSSEELKLIFGKKGVGQKIFSEEEEVHTPGDEFEDLEFLKEDIDKLMNDDYE